MGGGGGALQPPSPMGRTPMHEKIVIISLCNSVNKENINIKTRTIMTLYTLSMIADHLCVGELNWQFHGYISLFFMGGRGIFFFSAGVLNEHNYKKN